MNDEKPGRVFTVYRMDFEQRTQEPIGEILERRKSMRQNNHFGLLQLARKLFSTSADEAVRIGVADASAGEFPAIPK
ncbi:MAG: hypothetical protein AB1346_11825 [Thermodesulfobacteriota bacterium]